MYVFKNDRENLLLKSKDELIDLLIAVEQIKNVYADNLSHEYRETLKKELLELFNKNPEESL